MKLVFALLLVATNASAVPLYYCLAPPAPCQTLTLFTSWSLSAETGRPENKHVIVNGHDYGVAAGTSYSVPNSIIVPDKIFAAKFE